MSNSKNSEFCYLKTPKSPVNVSISMFRRNSPNEEEVQVARGCTTVTRIHALLSKSV